MSLTTESTFETAILNDLVTHGGYAEGDANGYDPETGFFREEILAFIQESQPRRYAKLRKIHGADEVDNRILRRLYRELDLRGVLDVVRNGITDYGIRLQLAYFQPATGLNPETQALYATNRPRVVRQVYFSKKTRQSIDLVLVLNGLPLATIELKNQITGQQSTHAREQYEASRTGRDILFRFNKRALVHFAVDQDEVFMATKLDGANTRWLPFNRGYANGAGNPPAEGDYRTAYLWRDVLTRDSWLAIVRRFMHLEVERIKVDGRERKREKLIFPRYHQLDAVRKITTDLLRRGAGNNYLVQHSAGSGKSNTIAWLAYRLSSLHDATDRRLFDSVVVITDRRVLDRQLQDTIYQFEHKNGVVQKIDKHSKQLVEALEKGVNIIITTLQKFPVVIDRLGHLPERNYAVVIDEAHSSQGGESSKALRQVLGAGAGAEEGEMSSVAEEPYPHYGEGDDSERVDDQDLVAAAITGSARARGRQANVSFFAFTATPKYKTLQVFGSQDGEGRPAPFHLYSMRQAIEEGFILDVLQNYTTYALYFRLGKAIADDPQLNKRKAARAIGRFVNLHPYNLTQKTEIIIEHFRAVVARKIGGKAKAMVVCRSRKHAKRYFEEFNQYIKEKGYADELKVLVAFSGKVIDDNYPDGVSEPQLTGFGEKQLPEVFDGDDYRVLIVADKYQTGFDQPLLHTMYVDKPLAGVRAVQTLSRLNRTHPGKEDTFVLDFANEREDILAAFQPYYEVTAAGEDPEINHLYDLKHHLDQAQVYWREEIDAFAEIYFHPRTRLNNPAHQRKLYATTDPAKDRFRELEEDPSQDEFKRGLRGWTNLYAFLAQIMPFVDPDLEKFYAYAKVLQTRLPRRDLAGSLQLTDEVALEYYRLQKISEGNIELQKDGNGELSGVSELGLTRPKEEDALLSEIVNILNDRFGTEFDEADKLYFDQIEQEMLGDEDLMAQARANKLDTFKFAFDDKFFDKLIDRREQNEEIFTRILGDPSFGDLVRRLIMKQVFRKANDSET